MAVEKDFVSLKISFLFSFLTFVYSKLPINDKISITKSFSVKRLQIPVKHCNIKKVI